MKPKLKATRSDVEVAENEDVSVKLEPEWSVNWVVLKVLNQCPMIILVNLRKCRRTWQGKDVLS